MDPLDALQQLGLALPPPPAPGGNYTSAKTAGNIVYLSGVISQTEDGILTGTVGLDRSIEEGYAAARACALLQLAVLQQASRLVEQGARDSHGERLRELRCGLC